MRLVSAFVLSLFVFTLTWIPTADAVTPRPPKPKLFATAPEDCLFFFHSFGFTKADPNSTNKTEQLANEPSVQSFIGEVKSLIDQGKKMVVSQMVSTNNEEEAEMSEDAFELFKKLIDRPFTFYIADVEIGQFGPEDLDVALVLDAGDKVDVVEKQLLKFQDKIEEEAPEGAVSKVKVAGVECHCLKDPNADGPGAQPPVFWGKVGSYILVGIGSESMESLMKNVKAPAPSWQKPAVKRVNVPRRWSFTYANVEKLNSLIADNAPPEVTDVMASLGVTDISTITGAMGLDSQGMLSRSLIETKSDRGLLGLFDKNGITAKDLEEVPKEAIGCMAIRMDPEKITETILDLAVQISPDEGVQVQDELDNLSEAIGVDIRKELLAGLGDRWLLYSMPGAGGAMPIPDMVISVDVRDAAGVEKGLSVLKEFVDGQGGGVSIDETKVGDRDAFYLKGDGLPVAPTWCLTKDRLVFGMQKASIAKLLDSELTAEESLASVPRVKQMFGKFEKPLMFSYSDPKTTVTAVYQVIPMMLNMVAGPLEEQGIDFDVTSLPPVEDILKHLDTSVSVMNRSPDGIEFVSRKTMPSISVAAVAPALVGVAMPAMQQARGAARQTQSMNNLKMIALACLNHESATQELPAGKYGDGKGLSWRVRILPYIEEQALYEKFNLDEPWDSEHNKKLIAEMPVVYRSPKSKAEKGKTNYIAAGGEDGIITGEDEGLGMRDIRDGTSKTILVVEASDEHAAIWTKPDDFELDEDDPIEGLVGLLDEAFLAVFCDGHVSRISSDIDEDVLKALFTRAGGEAVENF